MTKYKQKWQNLRFIETCCEKFANLLSLLSIKLIQNVENENILFNPMYIGLCIKPNVKRHCNRLMGLRRIS